jgi:chromosome segregation protein
MREILSAVFSTRAELLIAQQESVETALASIGDEGRRLESEIEQLNARVHQRRTEVGAEENALNQARQRHSEIELEHEKTTQRIERLHDQIRSLDERKAALADERARLAEELERNQAERAARSVQLAGLEQTRLGVVEIIERTKNVLTGLTEQRSAAERAIEELRRQQFEVIGNEARTRNEIASRRELIQRLEAQLERLEREVAEGQEVAADIHHQLVSARGEHSEHQSGMNQLKARLAEADTSCHRLRDQHSEAVNAVAAARSNHEAIRNRLETIGELAVRRAYSSEAVQQFFNYVRGVDWEPAGILADFIEVDPLFESVVEEFLRAELQYVVVKDRIQAERALSIVKNVTKGRLDCLVLDDKPSADPAEAIEGATPLAGVLRFDDRVKYFAGRLRGAYLVDSVPAAWQLAARFPHYSFIVRTGEVVRANVISWGQPEALGPLSLKREIRELDWKSDIAARETVARESEATSLQEAVREAEELRSRLVAELQETEKTLLTTDHRVQALAADFAHAEQRVQVTRAEIARFVEERRDLERSMQEAEIQLTGIAATRDAVAAEIAERTTLSESLLVNIEDTRRILGEVHARLAVLEERRSATVRELAVFQQQTAELEERLRSTALQSSQTEEQQDQTRGAVAGLEATWLNLLNERDELNRSIADAAARLDELRQDLNVAEQKWDEARAALDAWKDRHNALEIERTKVDSDLKHLASSCWSELSETIESVCLKSFATLAPGELLQRETEYAEIREKMDSMGAVNMMAVEEHQEAEQRFDFLSGQHQDLLDSIRDTAQAIDEIDAVCRKQFKDAFEAIQAGFREAFVELFGGGHGELRLMEEAEEADAGVEIVAQPPGKKLQNVLLLSGGEKALTALALLIALFRYKPSPFCVLDEVDAPLDDANVDRFASMVRAMSQQTQFIVITHSKRTMETASTLYGVTMEEPGISKIVSVRLN